MSGSNNNNDNSSTVVLVTGASGYIGSHCVKLLVKEGYKVRGTVRSLKTHQKVDPVKALDRNGLLELVEADLMNESCWESVVQGCDYILHVASPFPIVADESTIQIAINGTLNVLKAANKVATVRKVVLTQAVVQRLTSISGGSFGIQSNILEGHDPNLVFNETSWTNVDDKNVDPYSKSKTLAEKAAWDYVNDIKRGNKFALTAVNPTLVFGPMLISEQGASISLMRRFLNGEMPLTPPLNMGCVDVRDVAIGHLEAMRRPETDGERILLTHTPSYWFRDIARELGREFRKQGYWIPRYQAAPWMECSEIVMDMCSEGGNNDFFWDECGTDSIGLMAESCLDTFQSFGWNTKYWDIQAVPKLYGLTMARCSNTPLLRSI